MKKRAIMMYLMIAVILGGLIFRIYQLNNNQLMQAAENQGTMTVSIANVRGTIYDNNLQPLVNAEYSPRYSIVPSPDTIAALSGVMEASVLEKLTHGLQDGKPTVLSVDALLPIMRNISSFLVPKRYSEPLLAPHVIGYLNSDGLHGVSGIELAYDEYLNKCAGKASVTYKVDGTRKLLAGQTPVIENTLKNAKAGIALTLNREIQEITEKATKQLLDKGAVVVMEPTTGRILAMVSMPDYQPSTVADCLNDSNSPLLNRALCNYNLGSVFKIVSTAVALESGISINETYTCTGSLRIGDRTFNCHNRLGHGKLNMTQAFKESCNTYYIQLMLKAGGTRLYNMATTFGFDRPIYLADGIKTARALMPTLESLAQSGAVANMSFGQGELTASPIHVAQLTSTVLNGGELIRPTLFKGYVDADGKLAEEALPPPTSVFSKETADKIKQMMLQVVENGSGAAAKPENGGAGGKTGTAETGLLDSSGTMVVQSWFTGFFPAEQPKYVITVMSEDSGNSGVRSSVVFKNIADELMKKGF